MSMKVVILCGGFGTRLREQTEIKPKPMVEIGRRPILWHIMKTYAYYGFNEFILCLGYKGEVIKEYFYNYEILSNDFTIELGSKNIKKCSNHSETGWKITLVNTGLNAMTGARVKRIETFINEDTFMLTYGDGVTDLNIRELLKFHKKFKEKPKDQNNSINGGYFVFNKEFFNYLDNDDSCILEKEPLEKLASDGELKVFQHEGFWQCMDTYRDYKYLNDLWKRGNIPWKVW